ncbi:MAG: M48 family metallopeptidase [Methanomicrobiales archaeon]|nr:M48 family metallopeptidase [Methanomicrobiales archaeon]
MKEVENISLEYMGCDDLFLLNGWSYRLTRGDTCSILDDTVTYTTPSELKVALTKLLIQEIEEKVALYAPKMGCHVRKITIRTQKTRWGSCSGEGTLNFNLVMLALPPTLRTYIILHEIVHLAERNHAPAFWKLLSVLDPECAIHRKNLKKFWILVERNSIWRVLRSVP